MILWITGLVCFIIGTVVGATLVFCYLRANPKTVDQEVQKVKVPVGKDDIYPLY